MNIHLPRLLVLELIIIATGVILFFAGSIIAQFAQIALILAFALLVTYALLPLVNFLDRYLPRGLSILVVYLALLGVIVGFVAAVSVPLANQVQDLAKDYPQYVDEVRSAVPQYQEKLDRYNIDINLQDQASQLSDSIKSVAGNIVGRTGDIAAAIFGTLSTVFIVFFVSIYFLLQGKQMVKSLMQMSPKRRQRQVQRLSKDYDRILGSFVRGQLLISLFVTVAVSIFATVIGLPYSVVIGVVAGVTSLIPTIGILLGMVLPVVIAAFVNPILVLVYIVFTVLLNEFTDKVLYPRIVGRALDLHPLIVFFGVLIGVQVAGVAGALLATPLIALAKVTVVSLRNSAGYART